MTEPSELDQIYNEAFAEGYAEGYADGRADRDEAVKRGIPETQQVIA